MNPPGIAMFPIAFNFRVCILRCYPDVVILCLLIEFSWKMCFLRRIEFSQNVLSRSTEQSNGKINGCLISTTRRHFFSSYIFTKNRKLIFRVNRMTFIKITFVGKFRESWLFVKILCLAQRVNDS